MLRVCVRARPACTRERSLLIAVPRLGLRLVQHFRGRPRNQSCKPVFTSRFGTAPNHRGGRASCEGVIMLPSVIGSLVVGLLVSEIAFALLEQRRA